MEQLKYPLARSMQQLEQGRSIPPEANRTGLWLPFPPSINSCYATDFKTRRRFKSKLYRIWEDLAHKELQKQPHEKLNGPVEVLYLFGRPDKRKRDVFNYEKALTDFLVACRIIEDDSLITRGTVEWINDFRGVSIHILQPSIQA